MGIGLYNTCTWPKKYKRITDNNVFDAIQLFINELILEIDELILKTDDSHRRGKRNPSFADDLPSTYVI